MQVTGASIQQIETDKPKKRCRKWRLWLNVAELDKRPSKYFTGRYMDAIDALEAYKSEYENKAAPAGEFASYAKKWQEWRVKSGELAPGTLTNDKRNINALLRSTLATKELTSITPADCRDALMWVKLNPVKVGELSNTSMNKIYQTLNSIMGQAWEDGLITSNPMQRVSAPKPDTQEKVALSPEELNQLLDKLDTLKLDGRVMALYVICLAGLRRGEACVALLSLLPELSSSSLSLPGSTAGMSFGMTFVICLAGLRRGEACALLNDDISNGLLTVNKAVKERTGRIDAPKTPSGVRTLPIPERLQNKALEWLSVRSMASEYLCCNSRGGLLRPQLLQRWWAGDSKHLAVSKELGYEGITLHQLRHSNLSMVARYMSPYDLKTYAGWSSIEPAKVYIHDDLNSLKSSIRRAWS